MSILKWGLRFGLKIRKTTILEVSVKFFFFEDKKIDRSVF